ncbi:hypothetical protein WJX79_002306 [Trebouxia sp. C0005]
MCSNAALDTMLLTGILRRYLNSGCRRWTCSALKRRRIRNQHFWRDSDKLALDERVYVRSADVQLAMEAAPQQENQSIRCQAVPRNAVTARASAARYAAAIG